MIKIQIDKNTSAGSYSSFDKGFSATEKIQ